ncbi:MAG: prephenate dehydratase [Candidatus Methanomethylicia archaeon]|nr:prephenate dehydratase [Candidatus Methanomethylicia archaeon]
MKLDESRSRINKIDEEVVRLLDERAAVCREIGKIKAEQGIQVLDMNREREVLERAVASVYSAPPEGIRSIYKEIISMCRNVQKLTTVAFLGPAGSFSYEAALSAFGSSSKYFPCRRIKKIFVEVENGRSDLGVVPLENSLEGAVNETMDCFVDYPVSITGEIQLRISQNLIVDPKVQSLNEIERVYSHPQALAQCDGYVTKYLSEKEIVVTESTARAAEHVLRDRKGAAIGSSVAAELNGLKIYEAGIEDSPNNFTRFVVISKEPLPKGGAKSSVIFALEHVPGALAAVLDIFARHGINITMVISRPMPMRSWEYFFYIDFEGSVLDSKVESAVKDMRGKTKFLRVLGSYSRLQ